MAHMICFDCPSCGAPIDTPDDVAVARCEYCGDRVMIPESLRPTPPTRHHYGHAGHAPVRAQTITLDPDSARKIRRGLGCGAATLLLVIITAVVVPIGFAGWAILSAVNPGFLEDITGQGFARKELAFGGKGRGPGLFEGTVDITSDAAGDIYVLDGTAKRVQRFDKSGAYLNGWAVDDGTPTAIVCDREVGEIYVVSGKKIHKFEATTGNLLGTPVEQGSGFFPTYDMALLSNGDLLTYVSGTSDDLVLLDQQGQDVARFVKAMSSIYGANAAPASWNVRLTVDFEDRLLVLNKSVGTSAEVVIYDSDGQYGTRFGGGVGASGFRFANSIATDGRKRIYVSDLSGIRVFDYAGRVVGTITLPIGTTARAIETTANGELLVVTNSQEIMRFAPRER